MPISLSLITATLTSCATAPPPRSERELQQQRCTEAYEATVETLTRGFERAARPVPSWPSAEAYLQRCLGLGMSARQLRCLSPQGVLDDPGGCDEAMAAVRVEADTLPRWFMDQLQEDHAPAEEAP